MSASVAASFRLVRSSSGRARAASVRIGRRASGALKQVARPGGGLSHRRASGRTRAGSLRALPRRPTAWPSVSSCENGPAPSPAARLVTTDSPDHAQAGVAGADRLGHGRHPDQIGAERPEGADLGRGLEARSQNRKVDAARELDAEAARRSGRAARARPDRRPRRGRESAGPIASSLAPTRGFWPEQVDVVGDQRDRARRRSRGEASRRRWSGPESRSRALSACAPGR